MHAAAPRWAFTFVGAQAAARQLPKVLTQCVATFTVHRKDKVNINSNQTYKSIT